MGTVPDSYFEFVMHYAPFYYVIPTAMALDPPAGQKNVTVAMARSFSLIFLFRYPIQLKVNGTK